MIPSNKISLQFPGAFNLLSLTTACDRHGERAPLLCVFTQTTMLPLAIVWSVYLGHSSTNLVTVCQLLARLVSSAGVRINNYVGKICPAMHMQGTAAPWLSVVILRWLKPHNGSRQILPLPLATILSLFFVLTVKAAPAFLATSCFSIYQKELASYRAGEPNSRSSRSPKLFSSLLVAPSSFGTKKLNRCYAVPVAKGGCAAVFPAQDPRPRAALRKSSECLTSNVEDNFRRSDFTNITHQFLSSSHGRGGRGTWDAVSAGFAYTHPPSSRLFSTSQEQSGLLPHPFRVPCAHLGPAIWPGARRTFAFAATDTAQTAPETPAKDVSLLAALKRLRALTGCSIIACKEAIQSTKGDIQASVDWLRRRGLAVGSNIAADASSILQRQQTEGVIAVASWRASPDDVAGGSRQNESGKEVTAGQSSARSHEGEVALKLSCSTDFVAQNKRITRFARRAAVLLAEHLQRVGLRGVSTAAANADRRVCARADSVISSQAGRQPSSEPVPHPSEGSGKVVVARGAPLVEGVLSLPWSAEEEALEDADDASAAETTLFRAGNFFQEQQQMARRGSRQKKGQSVQVSEKEEGSAQANTKRGKPAAKGTMKNHTLENTQCTIREELQYLSSIVQEPLSITDAVAIEVPVGSGAVASYVHGIIDKQVGTLAVLAALVLDHEKDGGTQSTAQPTRRSPLAPIEELQGTHSSQGFRSEQHQLQREELPQQRKRTGGTHSKSETPLPPQHLDQQGAPKQRTDALPEMAARYGLTERMRILTESICMQVAAGRPVAVDEKSLDRDLLEREKSIYRAQAEATGKPPATIERMVTGKVNKWLKDVLLLRQEWLLDDSGVTVQQKLSEFARQQHMKKAPRIETFVQIQVH